MCMLISQLTDWLLIDQLYACEIYCCHKYGESKAASEQQQANDGRLQKVGRELLLSG